MEFFMSFGHILNGLQYRMEIQPDGFLLRLAFTFSSAILFVLTSILLQWRHLTGSSRLALQTFITLQLGVSAAFGLTALLLAHFIGVDLGFLIIFFISIISLTNRQRSLPSPRVVMVIIAWVCLSASLLVLDFKYPDSLCPKYPADRTNYTEPAGARWLPPPNLLTFPYLRRCPVVRGAMG